MGASNHFKKNQHKYILLAIFLLTLSIRLYFAFQSPYFEYDSYQDLRQIEHVKQTFAPLIHDDLSYSGRVIITTPLYYYLIALFNLIMPITLIGKILPNLIISMLVFIIYLISYQLTKNKNISLFTCFISIFVPIFFSSTLFTLSAQPIAILLILMCFYCLMRINESEKYVNLFLIIAILLPLIHGSSLLLVAGLLFYLFLIKIEGFNLKKSEIEIITFSIFFIAWTLFLIFKKAILVHGPSIIWQNLPSEILSLKFTAIDIIKYIYYIGIIPLIFGIWSVYRLVFKQRDINSFKFISFLLTIFLLLFLRLLDPVVGISYIGLILIILSSKIFLEASQYIEKTKAARFKKWIFVIILIAFISTSFASTVNLTNQNIEELPQEHEIDMFRWLNPTMKDDEVLLAGIKYGHIINYYSEKRNVFDNNFLYIEKPGNILKDVKRIYQTSFEVEAVRLINKYNINYILITPQEGYDYDIEDLSYGSDEDCFKLIYNRNNIKIYKFLNCKTT